MLLTLLCHRLASRTVKIISPLPCSFAHTLRNTKRGNFAQVGEKDLQYFESVVDSRNVVTRDSDLEPYNTDWLKQWHGSSKTVLRPRTTRQVSAIVKYCNEHNLAICPQGGNTGLVGGSVPVFDEILISTSLMNRVIGLDENAGVVTCEAGCVLENIDQYVSQRDLMVPLDLGARGTCQIGGNVSTNAGGIRLLRYGSLHENVLGLEVVPPKFSTKKLSYPLSGEMLCFSLVQVLSNGDTLDCMNTLRKNNTGYDLKHLFIGSEGTLGIVTKVSLLCPHKPSSVNVTLLGLQDFSKVLDTLRIAKRKLGEVLSAFEFIDHESMQLVEQTLSVRNPLEQFPCYALLETLGSHRDHDEEKMSSFLEEVLKDGVVLDGVHTSQPSKIRDIWAIRERITEACKASAYVHKYDVSLPLSCYYDVVLALRDRMGDSITKCIGFGHVGDGNLHLNLIATSYNQETYDKLIPFLFEWISKHKGSISAEHGLGQEKRNYAHYSKSAMALKLMKNLKRQMDPKGILNPYKVFADSDTYY